MKLLLEETRISTSSSEAVGFLVEDGGSVAWKTSRRPIRAGRRRHHRNPSHNGKLHTGSQFSRGRGISLERASSAFPAARVADRTLKTGTPPRILAKTIDFSA
jgi:hypothetical protein